MITHGFIHLRPISRGAGRDGLRLRPGKCGFETRDEAAFPLAEQSLLRRVDGAAWGWRRLACLLVFLPVMASVAYLYFQGATAFYRTFSQPTSLGSEWDVLGSGNSQIPTSTLHRHYP